MFNSSTSRIILTHQNKLPMVILPKSEKLLTLSAINQKIAKALHHIKHLGEQLSDRNTHGGKCHRSKQTMINNQISLASKRLGLLESAQQIILDDKEKVIVALQIRITKSTPTRESKYSTQSSSTASQVSAPISIIEPFTNTETPLPISTESGSTTQISSTTHPSATSEPGPAIEDIIQNVHNLVNTVAQKTHSNIMAVISRDTQGKVQHVNLFQLPKQ